VVDHAHHKLDSVMPEALQLVEKVRRVFHQERTRDTTREVARIVLEEAFFQVLELPKRTAGYQQKAKWTADPGAINTEGGESCGKTPRTLDKNNT
jgi:hypothetical protein